MSDEKNGKPSDLLRHELIRLGEEATGDFSDETLKNVHDAFRLMMTKAVECLAEDLDEDPAVIQRVLNLIDTGAVGLVGLPANLQDLAQRIVRYFEHPDRDSARAALGKGRTKRSEH